MYIISYVAETLGKIYRSYIFASFKGYLDLSFHAGSISYYIQGLLFLVFQFTKRFT